MKIKFALLLISATIFAGCTSPDSARQALENAGYTNVQPGGYAWFGGSKEDFYNTKFTAIGPNGRPVSGVVSKGLFFKGSTIRLD